MTSVDVVCPVFREEAAILRFHDELQSATAPLTNAIAFRFSYVVDPSGDRSEEIMRERAEPNAVAAALAHGEPERR